MFARTALFSIRTSTLNTISKPSPAFILRQQQPLFSKNFSQSAFKMVLISDAIKDDHSKIREYYQNVMNATDADTATRWQNQFVWELARHSVAEELIVYPAFESHLGEEGLKMSAHDRDEHHRVKEQLKVFQNLKFGDPKFKSTLESLMSDLNRHIEEEESQDMPKLEAAIDDATSEKLTKSFGRTKAFVPSRAHTASGSGHEGPAGWKPPFETAMGLMVAPIDHVRDMFAKFPDTISPNPSTK